MNLPVGGEADGTKFISVEVWIYNSWSLLLYFPCNITYEA